jgi:threonine/homoserine/homoserine lactone efflux protein
LNGFLSGPGAATADMIYGAIAAFGLTFIMNTIIGQAHWLKPLGRIFLLYLGIRTFLSKPAGRAAQVERKGLLGNQ